MPRALDKIAQLRGFELTYAFIVVGVAQSVERGIVIPVVVGSIPIVHPNISIGGPSSKKTHLTIFRFEVFMSVFFIPGFYTRVTVEISFPV